MTVTSAPTAPDATKTMSPRAWIVSVLGIVALLVGVNLFIAWRVDPFGILRDPRGRALYNSRHERKAKYLLNFKYVPENFDGLVIGASASANWQLEGLSPYHFYNESMLGADGTEERKLVEKALETGHFKVALVGISRGVTDRHDLQDGLDEVNPHEAFGSIYSYAMMLDRLHDTLLHRKSDFYPDGSWQFPQHTLELPKGAYKRTPIDARAAEDYRILVNELIAHGVRIIYVVSPHFGLDLDGSRQILDEYTRNFLATMPPAPVINFNDDQYAAIRADPNNMIDEDHLATPGVPIYSRLVMQRMQEILNGH